MLRKNISNIIKELPEFISLSALFSILNAHGEARLVGGCVRDMLMGYPVKDIDIAVNIKPHVVCDILEQRQIKCIPTGIKFGTVTALIGRYSFQITTLRQDLNCDGRYADVAFCTDWEKDATRRDFTFNSLYADLDGALYDYCDGMSDLEQKAVRFIGEPEMRIKEDYLRILRYFRFLSYIGIYQIDMPSLLAVQKLSHNLSVISGERIQSEMFKLLGNKFAFEAFLLLCSHDIHESLMMPPLQRAMLDGINMIAGEHMINLAAILTTHRVTREQIQALSSRWKLSKKDHKLLQGLCLLENKFHLDASVKMHKQHCYRLGRDLYEKQALLYLAARPHNQKIFDDSMSILENLKQWVMPTCPISGEDLLAIGFQGEEIGKALLRMEDKWVSSDFMLTREQLLQM